jgi:hypothetical protein
MTVDFRVLKNSATPAVIEQMCLEMDRRMSMGEPDTGRTADSHRWKIGNIGNADNSKEKYPVLTNWIQSIIQQEKLHLPPWNGRITLMAYVRQVRSNRLHTDHNPNQGRGHTIILPLRHIEPGVDRTVVFDYSTWVDPKVELIQSHNARIRILDAHETAPIIDDHQKRYQLEHLSPVVNRLRIAGVFEYNLGDAVCFDAHALHASSDWQKHSPNRSYKDYLLVHTTDSRGWNFQESLKQGSVSDY